MFVRMILALWMALSRMIAVTLGMIVLRMMAEAFRTIYFKDDKCTRE
jgi:hypothetical protein